MSHGRAEGTCGQAQGAGGKRGQLTEQDPQTIANRYRVVGLLGRGGMASAYRVQDARSGHALALKMLHASERPDAGLRAAELFEREYHTLNHLAHPRIVRTHDYGLSEGRAYYTMELLDGGDLREQAPLPWQEVCAVAYDVCSALSLLHSRRLVHRDVTPRNVRRTGDGQAKLIDFGLLSAMGPPDILAGTPPYVAPELVHNASLDGRSDLFSLGTTLYFALTGHVAFPARRFEQLRDAWRTTPRTPCQLAADVPPQLEALILALMRIDAGSRPKSAAEVMDRLRPLLARPPAQELSVANAYLSAPALVGRDAELVRMRKQIIRASRGRGGGFLIHGEAGSGRSRMIDTLIVEAKLLGATVLRAGARDAARGPLGVVHALVDQLSAAVPELPRKLASQDPEAHALLFGNGAVHPRSTAPTSPTPDPNPGSIGMDRARTLQVLADLFVDAARRRPLTLVVDDLDQADEASAALIATLAVGAAGRQLCFAVAVETGSLDTPTPALALLKGTARTLETHALSGDQTGELMRGLFGSVPNVRSLGDQVHALSAGRPRDALALAQSLVDADAVTYENGQWTLPAQVPAGLLPGDMAQALEADFERLSPDAMQVGHLLALSAIGRVARAELIELGGLSRANVDAALDELRRAQWLAGDPDGYVLCHPAAKRRLQQSAEASDTAGLHAQLAAMRARDREPESLFVHAYHDLQGCKRADAIDRLVDATLSTDDRSTLMTEAIYRYGAKVVGTSLRLALTEAERLGRPERQLSILRGTIVGFTAQEDETLHALAGPAWLATIRRDSGYDDWLALSDEQDPMARTMQALASAQARYDATPEAERVMDPKAGIEAMMAYVVCTIPVAQRLHDLELFASLSQLLEPFRALNPLVDAMASNVRGGYLVNAGEPEAARTLLLNVLEALGAQDESRVFVQRVRAAVTQAVASAEALMGIQSRFVHDPRAIANENQRAGLKGTERVLALQRGDWVAAEACAREAELILLRSPHGAMFVLHAPELDAHGLSRDLTGLKELRNRIAQTVKQRPRWYGYLRCADAHYYRSCGEPERALEAIQDVYRFADEAGGPLPAKLSAQVMEVDVLLRMGEPEQAERAGLARLAAFERNGQRHFARLVSLGLAMAEAALGKQTDARARVERVIEAQEQLGITGLLLGHAYECLARIAMVAGDQAAFKEALDRTAAQYRPGESEVLGSLYQHLIEDARQAGLDVGDAPAAIRRAVARQQTEALSRLSHVGTALAGCGDDPGERAAASLALLLEAGGDRGRAGFLYLLTESGLELCAAQHGGDQETASEELLSFANAQLDLEFDDDSCTVDTGDLTVGTEAATDLVDVEAGLLSVPLRICAEDGERVLGIALLAGDRIDIEAVLSTAAIIAETLARDARYHPRHAA